MAIMKIRGIVIAEASMGDKDKRLTVLTREQGKLSVLAKGAKSAAARCAASAQLFCYSDFVLDRGRTFYYIKESEILDSFYELRTNMDALSYASVMLEMAGIFSLDGEDNTPLMRLLLEGLRRCKRPEANYRLISLVFMMRLVCENGFLPNLYQCVQCGRPFDMGIQWSFSSEQGGLRCETCSFGSHRRLRSGTLSALQYITGAPLDKVYSFTITSDIERELAPLIRQYVTQHAGIHLNSLDFVMRMENFT